MAGFKSPEWASRIDTQTAGGVIDAISRPRLSSYGMIPDPACDLVLIVARHGRNIVVCEALYPLLHLLEVVVRNRLHDATNAPWPRLLKSVLPRAPRWARARAKVLERLEKARRIRNRVFHHEPVAHITDLSMQHDALTALLGWFSPDARTHLTHVCRFRAVWRDDLVPMA